MKHLKTRVEVEREVGEVEQGIRWDYDLSDNWYGDTYGEEVEDLMFQMCHVDTEEEYQELLTEVLEAFKDYAKNIK